MVSSPVSRRARRIGYGIAFGLGIALAPIAAGSASADPGPTVSADGAVVPPVPHRAKPAAVPARAVAAKPVVVRKQVVAKPVVAPKSAAAPKAVAKPFVAKPAVAKPVAVEPAAKPAVAKYSAGSVAARKVSVTPAARGRSVDRRPVVVIGASVSSGKEVSAAEAYPRRVAAMSGRPVRVSARVGAGYADGSIAGLARAADLRAQNPSLVVLQAGSNDVGAPPSAVAGQVRQVVSTVRQQAPGAKIAVVTVFPSVHNNAAAHRTDDAIIGAARSVDPSVAVISPLGEGWRYRSAEDGHPGAAAHARVAARVSGLA